MKPFHLKLFADDTSLFSVVQNKNNLASQLNNDLNKVSDWAYTWKMSFNPDPSKQAQEVVFSRKCTKENHPPIYFNDIPVTQTTDQKHIGLYLDEKHNYNTHIKEKPSKVYIDLGLLRNFSNKLAREALLIIYKVFIRSHLTMAILRVISQIMKNLLIKLRKRNMMQHWQSLVQSRGHLKKNYMLNLALNLSNLDSGLGNWLVFIKFSLQDYLSIYVN